MVWGKARSFPRIEGLERTGSFRELCLPFLSQRPEQRAIAIGVGFLEALTEAIAQMSFLGVHRLQLDLVSPLLFRSLDASIVISRGRG